MNIVNVLRVVKAMKGKSDDEEAVALVDGALFSAVRQIFFAENVLRVSQTNSSSSSNKLLESTLSELKQIILIGDESSSISRFPFSSLWLQAEKNTESEDDPIRSLIRSEVNLLNSFDSSSKDINIVLEHF